MVSSHSSSYMLHYSNQGSCTFPYQSTGLDIRGAEPGCIFFRDGNDTALIQSALVLDVRSCLTSYIGSCLHCESKKKEKEKTPDFNS